MLETLCARQQQTPGIDKRVMSLLLLWRRCWATLQSHHYCYILCNEIVVCSTVGEGVRSTPQRGSAMLLCGYGASLAAR